MTIEEILLGESRTMEFKKELSDKSSKYMNSVVAFSNTSGGKIIIGVEDKTREVVGVPIDKAFEIIDSITNAISDSCTPQIIPDITLQTINDKTIVVVSIYPGRQRPYYITTLGKHNGVFIRTSGSSRRADEAQIKELEFEGANRYFDQTYSVGYTVSSEQINKLCSDMKDWALKACKTEQEKKNVKDITKGNLISWGLLSERDGELFPTNGFLLLTENPFPQAKIQCAVFKGTTRNIFVDKREYSGPIHEQIEEAYQFVLRNIKLGATIRGLYRVDDYELPIESIRELICNAITHRSYIDEGCVQVILFDDRLEVTSPGMLFGGLSIDDLKEGQSRPRNRGIASAFVAMKVIEQWGTGIPRIIEASKEYGLQELELIEIGMDFRVNLYRKHAVDNIQSQLIRENSVQYYTDNQLVGDEKQLFGYENQLIGYENQLIGGKNQLIEKQKKIIYAIKGNSVTKEKAWTVFEELQYGTVFGRTEIMKITGLSPNAAGSLINKLKDADLIVPVTGKGKGKYMFAIK